MSFLRSCSIEAIISAIQPRTHRWPGPREQHRIPADEAIMALSGVEPVPWAFLMVSMGDESPGHLSACRRHLMGCAGWEAEAENWPVGRLARMADLALDELAMGYEAAAQWPETARAGRIGVGRSQWYALWRARYQRILGDALDQVSRAHQAMARRVGG